MALPVRRAYKGAPVSTTLSSSVNSSATTVNVASVTGWPSSFPFFAVIDPGTSKEEKVRVTNISTLALTVVRGVDDTTAAAHDAAAVIYPVFTATEADEANQIASVMTTKGDIISTDGSSINRLAVGATNAHVLQVDSAQTNGIKWGQVATAGIADSAITSAKIADRTVVADDIALATLKVLCPVGTIAAYGGAAAPTGWLLCDGSSISVSYTELRALVGTTTPDMKGRFPIGDNTTLTLLGTGGSLTIAEANLPSHRHSIDHDHASFNTASGGSHSHTAVPAPNFNGNVAVDVGSSVLGTTQPTSSTVSSGTDGSSHAHAIDVPAFTGNSGYTGSGTDYYQPYLVVNYIIKHDY
jgi:microcystin-dependent protein